MNLLLGVIIGWFLFSLTNIVSAIGNKMVDNASDQIVAKVLAPDPNMRPYQPREEIIEKVIVPPKPKDVKREAFLETCPKYGFSQKKCEQIWHEDDQTALTPAAKGVKIEVTETPLIEEE
jgi:hypothetical protein